MDLELKGAVAMVSGATQGIGLEVAEALAAEGALLSICSRRRASLAKVEASIAAKYGVECLTYAGDLTDKGRVTGWIEATIQKFGAIDVLVNNASATRAAFAHDASPEQWNQALALKLFGYRDLAAGVFPYMKAAGGGAIINIIGTAAVQPSRAGGVRTVAATALAGLNKALSNEGAAYNIRVNAVCPGHTRTYRWDEWLAEVRSAGGDAVAAERAVLDDIPMGRIAEPGEVASTVAFLASQKAAGYITGVMLNVDGGYVRAL